MTPMKSPKSNIWIGATATSKQDVIHITHNYDLIIANKFLSLEPLHDDIAEFIDFSDFNWVIIGTETGKRKNKVIPKREWIEQIINVCREWNIPVFIKDSLADIWGEPLIQEFPWEDKKT